MNEHVKLLPGKTEIGQVFDSARPDVFGIRVGVGDGVRVGVLVGVLVEVLVGVLVGVLVEVGVGVGDAVKAGVDVIAWVGVQVRTLGEFVVPAVRRRPERASVAPASTRSVINVLLPTQAGAVSFRIPVHLSVALPFGPRVVTGIPFWLQAAAEDAPPGYGKVFVTERLTTL